MLIRNKAGASRCNGFKKLKAAEWTSPEKVSKELCAEAYSSANDPTFPKEQILLEFKSLFALSLKAIKGKSQCA
ncbi:MAG: hypothetical protein BGO59_28805 [Spirosoma sp. 48-14]|nr:MAG: hypothetical protein BGO59_28805 [Spirosoma sp. 48-14]